MEAGRELDALVAEKVMGLDVVDRSDNIFIWVKPKDRKEHNYDTLPHYSTRIADAWMVVEKMREQGYRWVINSEIHEWDIYLEDRRIGSGMGHAPTAPEAICLAALKAVG